MPRTPRVRKLALGMLIAFGLTGCSPISSDRRQGFAPASRSSRAASSPVAVPAVLTEVGADGKRRVVPQDEQQTFEREVLGQPASSDVAGEVFGLNTGFPGGGPGTAVQITVRDGRGTLRWS